MSCARRRSLLVFGGLLACLAVSTPGLAQESREWTNTKGKSVTGTMVEKGDGWVKVEIKSKVHKIKLETLSKEDQEYVRNTRIRKEFACKVKEASRKASNIDFNIRTVTLQLEGVADLGEVYCQLVWISSLRTGGGPSIKAVVEAYYDRDGEYSHEAMFSNNAKVGESYRGYAYRFLDERGNKLAESGNPSSFVKYLDKARSSFKPLAKEAGEKK